MEQDLGGILLATIRLDMLAIQCVNVLPLGNCVSFYPSAIIENMAEFRPGLCTEAAQQGLMQWLLKRIKVNDSCL